MDPLQMKVGRDLAEDMRRQKLFAKRLLGPHADDGRKSGLGRRRSHSMYQRVIGVPSHWIESALPPTTYWAMRRSLVPLPLSELPLANHCHSRVMFKQLLQAGADNFCQIDSCRLGGVNEVLAVL